MSESRELLVPSNLGEEVWVRWDENGRIAIVAYNQGGFDHTDVSLDVILAWVARNRPTLLTDALSEARMARMTQYAIYENPSDYPGKFVVRRWFIEGGKHWPDKDPVIVAESLEAAQSHVPAGHYRVERFADDDPCIREVWL